jgi:hypothetical protein
VTSTLKLNIFVKYNRPIPFIHSLSAFHLSFYVLFSSIDESTSSLELTKERKNECTNETYMHAACNAFIIIIWDPAVHLEKRQTSKVTSQYSFSTETARTC